MFHRLLPIVHTIPPILYTLLPILRTLLSILHSRLPIVHTVPLVLHTYFITNTTQSVTHSSRYITHDTSGFQSSQSIDHTYINCWFPVYRGSEMEKTGTNSQYPQSLHTWYLGLGEGEFPLLTTLGLGT